LARSSFLAAGTVSIYDGRQGITSESTQQIASDVFQELYGPAAAPQKCTGYLPGAQALCSTSFKGRASFVNGEFGQTDEFRNALAATVDDRLRNNFQRYRRNQACCAVT
jgi:hypothetical protein